MVTLQVPGRAGRPVAAPWGDFRRRTMHRRASHRRLSRSELDATVRDLLGDTTNPRQQVSARRRVHPVRQRLLAAAGVGALIDSLEATADDIAARVLSAANRSKIVPCTPSGAGDAACFRQVIETAGRRLFRRPLSEAEVDSRTWRLQSFATDTTPGVPHDFYTAVALMLRSMLQDPEFLYRIEIGTPTADPGVLHLNGYEIATRLSFLLCGQRARRRAARSGEGRLAR